MTIYTAGSHADTYRAAFCEAAAWMDANYIGVLHHDDRARFSASYAATVDNYVRNEGSYMGSPEWHLTHGAYVADIRTKVEASAELSALATV